MNASSQFVAANLGQLGNRTADGGHVKDAPAEFWARSLQRLKSLGIDVIDPTDMWVPLAELTAERRGELREILDDLEIAMPAISLTRHSVLDPKHGDEHLRVAHETIDLAPGFGAQVVNVGFMQALTPAQAAAPWFWLEPGHVDDPQTYDEGMRRIRELAVHAGEVGIALSLEMYEDTFLGTSEGAVQFLEAVDHEAAGLNPDVGNFVRLHRDIEHVDEMFERVLPHTNFWHMKNYARDFDPATGSYSTMPVPMRDGYINYRAVIGRALELGFSGPMCCEHYGADSIAVVAENMRYVRSVVEYWS